MSAKCPLIGTIFPPRECGKGALAILTALYKAIGTEHLGTVQSLLEKGASTKAVRSLDGDTALHRAARIASEDIVRILLEYGANYELVDSVGSSALDHDNSGVLKRLVTEMGLHLPVQYSSSQIPETSTRRSKGLADDDDVVAEASVLLGLCAAIPSLTPDNVDPPTAPPGPSNQYAI